MCCNSKHDIEKIRYDFLHLKNLKLLSTTYKNNKQKLDYECLTCLYKGSIRYNNLIGGQGCYNCGLAVCKNSRRFSQEMAENLWAQMNSKLLESYKNSATPHLSECPECKEEFKITLSHLKEGKVCKKCGISKCSSSNRSEFILVKDNYLKLDLLLLEDEYINNKSKMKCKCLICNNELFLRHDTVTNLLKNRNKNNGCKFCAVINNSGQNHSKWIKDRNKLETIKKLHILANPAKRKFRIKHGKLNDKYVEVDHIFPIFAFLENNIFDYDLMNCEENLQFLTKKENLKKSNKYNVEEFKEYLKKNGKMLDVL